MRLKKTSRIFGLTLRLRSRKHHSRCLIPRFTCTSLVAKRDSARLINYHLRHGDYRLITGEEAQAALQQAGLQTDAEGLLEYRQADDTGDIAFRIASLSTPGDFANVGDLDFSTLGLNCFIDLDDCESPQLAYESSVEES